MLHQEDGSHSTDSSKSSRAMKTNGFGYTEHPYPTPSQVPRTECSPQRTFLLVDQDGHSEFTTYFLESLGQTGVLARLSQYPLPAMLRVGLRFVVEAARQASWASLGPGNKLCHIVLDTAHPLGPKGGHREVIFFHL